MRFRKWTVADCFGLVSKRALQDGLDIVGHTMENFGQSLKTLVAQVKRVKNKLSGQIDDVDKKLSSKIDRVDDRVKENLELTESVKTELDMVQATTEVIEVRVGGKGMLRKSPDVVVIHFLTHPLFSTLPRHRLDSWTQIPG